MNNDTETKWIPYLQRYAKGEWRAPIFCDLILTDAQKLGRDRGLVFLDIGCGGGFDGHTEFQDKLANVAKEFIGVEPDKQIQLGRIFTSEYRCRFEDTPIQPDSVDIAFAVMVLEHVADPELFWNKVYTVLRPGGVFWGFTIDARHWFVAASILMEKMRIKDWYLNMLHGKRGEERYENYPVCYKTNTPEQIYRMTRAFSTTDILNFHRIGQLDYYFPPKLQWIGRVFDRVASRRGWPGNVLAVRVSK